MRLVIILIFTFFSFLLTGGSHEFMSFYTGPPPDTIPPPPPPGGAYPLSGPGLACVGETSSFQIDVPVACICQWSVNGIVQPGDSSTFVITWGETGPMLVAVVFICSGGQVSDPEFKTCAVAGIPEPDLGNDTTILAGQSLVLDAGNPGSDYLWSTGETTRTITVNLSGIYSVVVSNFCGTDTDTIEVSVIVGIFEQSGQAGCFNLFIQNRQISFSGLPAGVDEVQMIDLRGRVVFKGLPSGGISIDHPGVYLVRLIAKETSCYKKVFIP